MHQDAPRTYLASELATHAGARVMGDGGVAVSRLASFDEADGRSITFIRDRAFAARWTEASAAAALISERLLEGVLSGAGGAALDGGRALLIAPDADLALIRILPLFAPAAPLQPAGVHASAVVHRGATVEPGASVGPMCIVEEGALVGRDSVLMAQNYIGRGVRIGERCVLHPQVRVLERCVVGNRCVLHAGATLGADGFGYRPAPDGKGLIKVPHVGNVVLGDDVEVGANTCIDRAKFGSTLIGAGTKIDNLVQIAHNVVVGRSVVICGGCGIAGSVSIGDGAMLGGQVGVADNLSIGAGARIGAQGGVTADVPPGADYFGTPAIPAREWRRIFIGLRKASKGAE
ncbi:MAG TPA: UDP-3-O-(3-hydroxymyristoyl)glucosamine N-acyltransferase [Phycisphaerales bacterium]|nr:UDP-3-O-(3-hydroxymyristoyl)glucosamine N-acyltransferase [Phycisphaerales bacterium]